MPSTWLLVVLAVGDVLGFAALPRVLLDRRESTATLSWVLGIVFVPYVGLLCFWLFGSRRVRRKMRRKARADVRFAAGAPGRADAATLALFSRKVGKGPVGIGETAMHLAERIGAWPATSGNAVELLLDGDATFDAIETAVRAARD